MRECLDAAAAGTSAVLVVPGPPGIGKTSLLAAAVQDAAGWTVLRTAGVRGESPTAFAGLLGLVRPVLGGLDSLEPVHRTALRRALGLDEGEPPTFFQVAAAALDLVAHVATEPVLLLVDDLHWLDEQSASVLLFVARRLRNEPVAVLVGMRDDTSASTLVADLPALPLGLLSDDAARACVLATAPDLTADLVVSLVESAGGNPLALVEGARDLDRGLRDYTSPTTGRVGDPFEQRIEECPDDVRDALLVCALEPTADRSTVEAALALLGVVDALPAAETLGLVVLDDTSVELAHPLVGEVVLRVSSPARRRAAHLALAGSFGAGTSSPQPWLTTWHLGAETDRPDTLLAARLETMGQAVAGRGDLATAAHVLRRAADLAAEPERRAQLLVSAGSAAATVGLPWAVELLEQARALTRQHVLAAHADRVLASIAAWTGDAAAAVRIARRVASGGDRGLRAFAHSAASATAFTAWDRDTMVEHGRLALEDAEGLPPPERFLTDVTAVQMSIMDPVPCDRATLRALADLMVSRPNPDMATPLVHTLMACEEWALADDVLGANLDPARRAAAMPAVAWMQGWVAQGDLRRGDLAAAEAAASESVSLAASLGLGVCQTRGESMLALIAVEAGRLEEGREHLSRTRRLAETHRVGAVHPWMLLVETRIALREGDLGVALAQARELQASVASMGYAVPALVPVHPELVEVLLRTGHVDEALAAVADLAELERIEALPATTAWLAYCRLLVADDATLLAAYDAVLAAAGPPVDASLRARSTLLLGERLRRRGDLRRAAPALAEALEWFGGHGYFGWARRARRGLDAIGGGEPGPSVDGSRDTLTPQERQIATLAVTGATTRDIATSLFLSPKTVEFHLTNVYRKMGVRSKTELSSHWR